jgi:hypothetical protein
MQVVNTKTQTTNTKRNNSMLFQDEEDLGKFYKFSQKIQTRKTHFIFKIYHHHQCRLV